MGLGAWLESLRSTARNMAALRAEHPRIVFLNQRWRHHGRRSGYLIDVGLGPNIARFDRAIPHPIVRWRAARTRDTHWEQEVLLRANLALCGAKLVHVVDGDFDTWAFAERARRRGTRVTATFHQPVDKLAEVIANVRPQSLDGIICMSRPQLPLLESLAPRGRCVVIPHGIESEFFHAEPGREVTRPPLLLSVGAHRRDFATLIVAARVIREHRPEAVIRLVAPQTAADAVRSDSGGMIETLSGISDEDLREQYRQASLLLMPLEAATANNALLEAMACSRPTVTTDLPDLSDYANGEAAIFCPRGDGASHAAAALSLLDDSQRRERMGRAARAQAESLAWPVVRARAAEFFERVIRGD